MWFESLKPNRLSLIALILFLDPGTHVGYGYCEAGFSSSGTTEPSDDNPLFVLGSPGAIRFSGALFTVDAQQNVKQTLRLRSGLSSSSYMGESR